MSGDPLPPAVDDVGDDAAEAARLAALQATGLLDTDPEAAYDAIVQLASVLCDVPIAAVSLVDSDRQWFKARLGLDVSETPRSIAFCDHAIRTPDVLMEVEDARLDPRFTDNPMVTGDPGIRFYAGRPLVDSFGNAMGTVCVIDRKPRQLSESQKATLSCLADILAALMDTRRRLGPSQGEG